MKRLLRFVTLPAIGAIALLTSPAAAIGQPAGKPTPPTTQQLPSTMEPHPLATMEMAAMKAEPHHLLATAYKDSLLSFAKTLRDGTAEATTVDTVFARAAVEEMTRSFAQMQVHHLDHMKTMDEKMKSSMAGMMKQMDAHHAAIQEHLTALEKDVQAAAPDAKSITTHVTAIITQCEGMSMMQSGTMPHKMGGTGTPK